MRLRKTKRWLRAATRATALVVLMALAAARWCIDPGCRRDPAGRARWLARLTRRMLRVMHVSVRSVGAPPAGGVLLTPNHLGYLDVLVLAATHPVVFVAKSEVRAWPVFGWMAAAGGTRFIERGRPRDVARIGAEIGTALARGTGVVVFLEGTSTDGRQVAPFHASLLGSAVKDGWAVAPVALGYRVEPGHSVEQEVAWWGDMTLTPHLWNLLTLGHIEATVAWGRVESAADTDRKALAARLRDEVAGLLGARAAALSAGAGSH
jgi:1-acyl-sn-glycerol-3-phosphate acyltransferase